MHPRYTGPNPSIRGSNDPYGIFNFWGYTPMKTNMTLENLPFSTGNTSSSGGFSVVVLVFRGYTST